jgi:hypothetical protein
VWFRRRRREPDEDSELAEPAPVEERDRTPLSYEERDALPTFRYHPDPVATGSVVRSADACAICGKARGFLYEGAIFGPGYDDERLCPWCIADGRAHEGLGVFFAELDDVVPTEVREEVEHRTPGFSGWQQERWLVHCGDAAAFHGRAGAADLPADGVEAIREEVAEYRWPPEEVEEYVASLDAEGGPTAYLFRCLHCGRHLAYSDTH